MNSLNSHSSKLVQARTFGGVGSILLVLSLVPYFGFVLGIIGLILILIAVKYISEEVNEPTIFNNILYAVIVAIIGIAISTLLGFSIIAAMFTGGGPPISIFIDGSDIEPETFWMPGMGGFPFTVMAFFMLILAVLWIILIVSAVFLRRGLDLIASHLKVGLFSTAGLLYLIGAFLSIILVGFLLVFIASILMAVAFFSLPDRVPQESSQTQTPGSGA